MLQLNKRNSIFNFGLLSQNLVVYGAQKRLLVRLIVPDFTRVIYPKMTAIDHTFTKTDIITK